MSLDFVAIQVSTFNGRDICRGRHELDDRVDHLLYTLVPVGRAAGDRDCPAFTGSLTKSCLKLLICRLLAFQIHFHQLVVQITDLFDQLSTIELGILEDILGNLTDSNVIALIVVIDIGVHFEQVDEAFVGLFRADRNVYHDSIFAQSVADLLYTAVVVSAHNVHLVDEGHSGNVVCVCLTPYVL